MDYVARLGYSFCSNPGGTDTVDALYPCAASARNQAQRRAELLGAFAIRIVDVLFGGFAEPEHFAAREGILCGDLLFLLAVHDQDQVALSHQRISHHTGAVRADIDALLGHELYRDRIGTMTDHGGQTSRGYLQVGQCPLQQSLRHRTAADVTDAHDQDPADHWNPR